MTRCNTNINEFLFKLGQIQQGKYGLYTQTTFDEIDRLFKSVDWSVAENTRAAAPIVEKWLARHSDIMFMLVYCVIGKSRDNISLIGAINGSCGPRMAGIFAQRYKPTAELEHYLRPLQLSIEADIDLFADALCIERFWAFVSPNKIEDAREFNETELARRVTSQDVLYSFLLKIEDDTLFSKLTERAERLSAFQWIDNSTYEVFKRAQQARVSSR